MHEPNLMCPALDRILGYVDQVECRNPSDRITVNELDKIRREIEKMRTRITNLREWGSHRGYR